MHESLATLLTSLVTLLAVLVMVWTFMKVGQMRGKHNIEAPAVTGNPEFERAYRVQMNTIEQIVIFLPLLWLSNAYFQMFPLVTGALGLVWIVGRIVYALGYYADPKSRSFGFLISILATLGLLITTIVGMVQAFMALNAV